MLLRFLLTFLPILLGGLYLLFHNSGDIPLTLLPGRGWRVPVAVVVLASALVGALGMGLSDLPSRFLGGLRRRRNRRTNQRLQEAESLYQSGLTALSSGETHIARRAFRRALRKNPAHPNVLLEYGNLQRRLGNLAAAFECHRKALRAGSDDLDLMKSLADDFASAGRPDALWALWERARQAGRGEAVSLERLRDYYVSQGEWEAAVNVQETLLRLPGEARDGDGKKLLANLLYEAGSVCVEAGRREEGMERLKQALRNDGDCIPAHVALGDLHHDAGESRNALRLWREGYDRNPASIFIRRIMPMLKTGGTAEEVLRSLRRTLRKHPLDDRLRLALAEAYLHEGRPDEALKELNNLSRPELHPQAAQLLRARALLELKDYDGAQAELSAGSVELPGLQCSVCRGKFEGWSGRCPSCGRWGTLDEFE